LLASIQTNSIFVFALIAFTATTAQAEFKIATVDINRIINESGQSQGIKKSLDQKTLSTKKTVEEKRSALKKLEDKLRSKNVEADSAEAQNFREQAKEFSRFVKDADEELKREFMKANRQMTEKTLKVVKDYALRNKIDLVLDKSTTIRGPVLFGDSGADITDEILKAVK
ncbi:MAG: OmpH family outer membrane protein, partial [Bdellovibrionales bacterium]|nr:OmpH family outer membrane protein [Bdellovibrionales bacterium]